MIEGWKERYQDQCLVSGSGKNRIMEDNVI